MSEHPPEPRQRIIRSRGGRRARLTSAPGTTAEPSIEDEAQADAPEQGAAASGPNDERLRRDVPPHY